MNIIMKKYYLLGILILLFASCIDDKSDLGLNHISQIKFKTQFEKDPYRCDQWSEFKLEPRKLNKLTRQNRLVTVGKSTIKKYLKKKT